MAIFKVPDVPARRLMMKYLTVMLMLLVVGIRAEAAHIPVGPQCQGLVTHVDVAACFGALNVSHRP